MPEELHDGVTENKDGTLSVSVYNEDNATKSFGTITFERAGTYEYSLAERDDHKGGITYDEYHTVTIVVEKAEDATNALSISSITFSLPTMACWIFCRTSVWTGSMKRGSPWPT